MRLAVSRLLAYGLDFVLLAGVFVGLQWLLALLTSGFPFQYLQEGYQIELWVLMTVSLPVWTYFIWCEWKRRQTIGKRLMKVVIAGRDSKHPTFKQAFVRTMIKLMPWELTHIIILVPKPWYGMTETPANLPLIYIPNAMIVLYIVILFAGRGSRGLHDWAAGTTVSYLPAQGRANDKPLAAP